MPRSQTRSHAVAASVAPYSIGESFPYSPNSIPSPHSGEIIRSERPKWANLDPRLGMAPPDWSGGYGSIFSQGQVGDVILRRATSDLSIVA